VRDKTPNEPVMLMKKPDKSARETPYGKRVI
jgi:hypothetical protein